LRIRRAQLAVDLLRCGHKIRFRVMGTSMLPAIPPGSLVMVEPTAPDLLKRGDVVLSNGAGRLIAHRIDEVQGDRQGELKFVLRGDNLPRCDLPVAASAILGRVSCLAANDNWRQTVGTAWALLTDLLGRERKRASGGAS
jgi:signal peptidase I